MISLFALSCLYNANVGDYAHLAKECVIPDVEDADHEQASHPSIDDGLVDVGQADEMHRLLTCLETKFSLD